jgi:hypothetical protein
MTAVPTFGPWCETSTVCSAPGAIVAEVIEIPISMSVLLAATCSILSGASPVFLILNVADLVTVGSLPAMMMAPSCLTVNLAGMRRA